MNMMSDFDRIAVDPKVMLGQPVIRGTRLPVYVIIEAISEGTSPEELTEAYSFLSSDDIRAALRYAARLPG